MLDFVLAVLAAVRVFVRSRSDTALELFALRQQVAVLKRQRRRPTPRPLLLDHPPASVAPMVRRAAHRETGDRGPVASSWLSPLLALAIPTTRGPAANQRGDSYPDPSPGGGECGLGRAQDPWGTLEARLRRLRTQRRPVSAPRATPRRSRHPLVGLPRQPPRGDRRLRFLHRPHVDPPAALVLLRHRTPSPHDSACQRDPRADARVGGATTAGRVSWRWSAPLHAVRPRLDV